MFNLTALALAFLSPGCATTAAQTSGNYLSEDEVLHLMAHPRDWDGRTVTVRIWPYDNGFAASYLVCFEACDREYADSSPFIVYTRENRFRGYRGDRPVVITARYSSACFYRSTLCPDMRAGQFTEVAAP